MFRSIGKLINNRRGAFAMQFALLAVPLTICTGLAIDGGRAFLARFELASALDAAALAVGSTLQNQGTDLDAVAAKFVEKNFRTEHTDPIVLTMTSQDDTIVLKGTVKINTYFMPIVGQPTVTINAESEVRRGGSNLEIALALDITGSMNATRMNGLKNAAKVLVSEVVNDVQTPFFSKVAIVPWSQAINLDLAGASAKGFVPAAALDQLRGALVGSKSVSDASWRTSGASTRTITEAGWRTTTGARTIASAASNGAGGVDWRYGAAVSVSSFAKVTISSSNRILVTTSSNHGYAEGDFVRLTGVGGSYTALNNNTYLVNYYTSGSGSNTTKTFYLRTLDDSAYVAQPSGSTSSAATSQRCHDKDCNVGVTTTADFTGLAPGDFVNITSVTGFPSSQSPNAINNSATTTWVVARVPSLRRFTLANWNGPNFGTGMNSGAGTVSECLVSDCRYRVTTSTAHNFSGTDFVALWNFTESGSGTSANSALNTTWTVQNPSGSIFFLPNGGKTYKDWTSGGSAAECQLATCNTRVTIANSGLNVGDSVELTGLNGLTGLNNPTTAVSAPVAFPSRVLWKVSAKAGNVLTLADTSPGMLNMANDYTSGGASQCLAYGCAKLGYLIAGGNASTPIHYRVWPASPCIVERYGDDRYTDVAPASAPLGINYTANGTCTRTNWVQPMTSNKTNLNAQINALQTGGNTAGQLGIGWAWYMLSPSFANVWSADSENAPLAYGAPENAKIAILMTDGEFNTQTCDGLYSSGECTPFDDSFGQAEKICIEMKKKNVIIYTVGLQLNKALQGDDFLLACATSPQHAFLADDNDELEQAFKDIAVSINRLRISR